MKDQFYLSKYLQRSVKKQILILLFTFLTITALKVELVTAMTFEEDDSQMAETHYKLVESHHLEFPSLKEFFNHW